MVYGFGCGVERLGLRVEGFWFMILNIGVRLQGLGFRA